MKSLESFFYGRIPAVRVYAISRVLPLLLAIDAWVLMIGHAGRYGVADFNVAHFSILDHIMKVPTPEFYIGLLVLVGILGLLHAFGQRGRALSVALCVLYTLSWSCSMLDSYQHHYFISLLLVCLIWLPPSDHVQEPPQESDDEPVEPNGGYALLTSTVAILYAYAALAKCDAAWVGGHTLRDISRAETLLQPLAELAEQFSLTQESFFALVATSVIPLELILAVAYALAPLRDRSSSRLVRSVISLGLLMALMLHVGAEVLDLKIGWFSYYMLALALICLSPLWLVEKLMAPLSLVQKFIERQLADVAEEAKSATVPWVPVLLMVAVVALLVYVGDAADLPGVFMAMVVTAAMLGGFVIYGWATKQAFATVPTTLALGASAVVLWLTLGLTEARFDYYRFLGGDLARRGKIERAIEVYRHGERYAPPGRSRRKKIEKLEAQLR